MILGRDWLKQNGVRLYFDLGYLRIGKTYVRIEEDIHISSLLRLCKQTTLAPNSVTICKVKVNQGFRTEDSKLADITYLDDGHLSEEPGIVVFSAVAKLSDSRKIPIMLINQTNKHFKLKRGEIMGRGGSYQTFQKIAEPLITLTKKYAKFKRIDECETAFKYLKDSLTVVPLLAYPDPNKPYVLYTDASDTCIGACLTQAVEGEDFKINGVKTEKPIYFLSHKLSPTQVKWSTVEKEAYAIHYALQKVGP
ncbi:unnamed protein product [Mytilus edulis]|uniref:Reverse transcriptase/retrotransposon-derived protein RNase H-like domain-containing protein n=1 Tax=Mytilus edulis TaxID=6550 RepID=A0A8S3T7M5_MYTED|nr:unnamed protein product [Mytilus edulis]